MQKIPHSSDHEYDVIVIGAGLSGLSAALRLERAGKSVAVLEAAPHIGGRVTSDEVSGFVLDRGFQIFLPSYPEAKEVFDYSSLRLRPFKRGARLFLYGKWTVVPDPFDAPLKALPAIFAPFASLKDKLIVATLALRAKCGVFKGENNVSTYDYLKKMGLSDKVIESFFTPFFKGVFLTDKLDRPSAEFAFYFSMFSQGGGVLPAKGMRMLPETLASQIKPGTIRLGRRVNSVNFPNVELEDGRVYMARDNIVVAVDEKELYSLFPLLKFHDGEEQALPRGTNTLYFSIPTAQFSLPPYLHLIPGSQSGISNIAPISSVASDYAPSGSALISVSVNDTSGRVKNSEELAILAGQVGNELAEVFGAKWQQVQFLKGYSIPHALPIGLKEAQLGSLPPGVLLAGDCSTQGSINGALKAGRMAAEKVLSGKGWLGLTI